MVNFQESAEDELGRVLRGRFSAKVGKSETDDGFLHFVELLKRDILIHAIDRRLDELDELRTKTEGFSKIFHKVSNNSYCWITKKRDLAILMRIGLYLAKLLRKFFAKSLCLQSKIIRKILFKKFISDLLQSLDDTRKYQITGIQSRKGLRRNFRCII